MDGYGENLEKIGEKGAEERRGEYADVWENSMTDGVPEFNGGMPWGYTAPEQNHESSSGITPGEERDSTIEHRGITEGASEITSYGLDTASRIYGLETVLDTIKETDEMDRDAANPIGSIYARLAPNPIERQGLFREIQNDPMYLAGADIRADTSTNRQNDAVSSTKKLLNVIETGDTFSGARKRAEAEGKTIIQYLTSGSTKPTLSLFFERVGSELGSNMESALAELEQVEAEKDQAEDAINELEELKQEAEEVNQKLEKSAS